MSSLALAPIAPNPSRRGATIDRPHALRWKAPGAASGVYFVQIEAGGRRASRKFVVLRSSEGQFFGRLHGTATGLK